MAVVFSGTKLPQTELAEIQKEIYADWGTFRDGDVTINEGHKSSADVYESKVVVNMAAYSSAAVTAGSDTLTAEKTPVSLTKVQFADTIDYNTLLDTRFERSMQGGAFNTVSSEFDNAVLQDISPAISETMESVTWDGATTAQKVLIAALTPGAAQGSLTAYGQTLVAAMPSNQFNSIPATLIHNASNAKGTPGAGLGDYRKVLTPIALTSANIAAQYLKMYETHFAAVNDSSEELHKIYAPLADKALMVSANKGATTVNPDFVEIGGKWTYNGYEVIFVPMVGFRIMCNPEFLMFLTDKADDAQSFEQQRGANLADFQIWKSIMFAETFPVNQRYITLYGG